MTTTQGENMNTIDGKTIATAYDNRTTIVSIERILHIQIQRFTHAARFLGTIQDSNLFNRCRYSCQKMLNREGTIQMHNQDAYLTAFFIQFFSLSVKLIISHRFLKWYLPHH